MMMLRSTRRGVLLGSAATAASIGAPWVWRHGPAQAAPAVVVDPRFTAPVVNPAAIPQFVSALPDTGASWVPIDLRGGGSTTIQVKAKNLQMLPGGYPATPHWCYRRSGVDYTGTYLGPTIVTFKGQPVEVTYDYAPLAGTTKHLLKTGDGTGSVVDQTLHGTSGHIGGKHLDPEPEVRFIAHLHGGKNVAADSDGYAEAWVTPDGRTYSNYDDPPGYDPPVDNKATLTYPNDQDATLSWYHDHALGITRLNVHAGLAAGYIVTDANEQNLGLPFPGTPLIIQDRMFYPDGRLAYPDPPGVPNGVNNVSILPEYFGDVIIVNGVTWPFQAVHAGMYRYRIINGCDSRVLQLQWVVDQTNALLPVQVIGTEGGFFNAPVQVTQLVVGPAERYDVIVDFRTLKNRTVTLQNKGAKKPFPAGTPPKGNIDGRVMRFVVSNADGPSFTVPAGLRPVAIPPAGSLPVAKTRRVLLFEGMDEHLRINPLLGVVDDAGMGTAKQWSDPITETPQSGTYERWEIYNTTADAHPIHLHAVFFQLENRQAISFPAPAMGTKQVGPITLRGQPRAPAAYENGLKDTVICPLGQVTRIIVGFGDPGIFQWHCHILEHEDHEMMRPYRIT